MTRSWHRLTGRSTTNKQTYLALCADRDISPANVMKSLMLELAQPRPKMDSGTFHGFGSVNVKREGTSASMKK